jgi:protein-disulfide isomerase
VVVVKFNDWLCPGCKAWEEMYDPVLAKYEREHPGAVKYVVKDLPWNTQCNATIRQTLRGHEGACDAAVAVRLAREAGQASAMIDWLFDNQQTLAEQGMAGAGAASRSIREKTAELLGVTDFDRELAARLPEIQRDVAEGVRLDVASTPTYFVNGVRTTSVRTQNDPGGQNLPPEYLDMAIEIELGSSVAGEQ